MQWTLKQLKNSTISSWGLALLVASCLVGWPRAASAQSSGTPLSDVTLEQFMNALEARYSNAQTYNFANYDLGSDLDVYRFPVVALTPNGAPVFFATFPLGPNGESLYYPIVASSHTLTNILDFLTSSTISNVLARVYNFMGSTYDSASLNDVDRWFTTFAASLSDIDTGVNSPQFSVSGYPNSQAPFALQTYDLATPAWLTAHSGDLGDDPVEQVLFVQDPLAAEKLDELIDGQSDLADMFTEGMSISEDSLYQMGEEIRVALEDVLPDLFGDSSGASLTDDPRNALTNMVSSERSIMDTEGLMFTNALYSVTGNVSSILSGANVGAFSNDVKSLLAAFVPNSGMSTVLQLTPSLDISTRPGSPSLSIAPIQVDLADSRFTVGGWLLWEVLRACCILGWWSWWLWFMYGFLRKWISKFGSLIGS